MLKQKAISMALPMFLLVLPALCLAQDMPHGKWWRYPRVAKQLDLSDEEKTALDEKFVESRRKLIGLKSNLEREQFELDNLLDSQKLDESAVREQFKRLEAARSDLSEERFSFLIEVRHILGFERFHKIKTLYELRRHKKGKKGDRLSPRGEISRGMAPRGQRRPWEAGPRGMADM
jgi:Spy/CpxP family protein refolding chaperone